jgi:hypothetical protein
MVTFHLQESELFWITVAISLRFLRKKGIFLILPTHPVRMRKSLHGHQMVGL